MRMLMLLVGLLTLGCKLVDEQPKGKSPLLPLASSNEALTLEVFSAPAPIGDPQLAALWNEVDEQPLPGELRQKLGQNGLRAGIVGPNIPAALAELLKVTDRQMSQEERALVRLDPEPGISLHVLQPSPGKRQELAVSQAYEEMSLLERVEGQVNGKTYHKAQGLLALRAFPEPDARVRLELTPELHHGEFRSHPTGSEGVFIWKTDRPKKVFAELKLNVTLGAGQMLLITCLSDRPGSIGHYFFTRSDGEKPTQHLWVIRVAQAGPDRAFSETKKFSDELPLGDNSP